MSCAPLAVQIFGVVFLGYHRHFCALLCVQEVDTFFTKYGLPQQYFEEMTSEDVAKHITSLQAAKLLAQASGNAFDISLQQEGADRAMFAARSVVKTVRREAASAAPLCRRRC